MSDPLQRVLRATAAFAFALAAPAAFATDGYFDPTFGSGGRHSVAVTGLFDDEGYRVAILPDGRLLLTGMCRRDATTPTFCATRLRADGTGYDTTFGPGGLGYLSLHNMRGFPDAYLSDSVLLPDGRIAMAGMSSDYRIFIAILKADGSDLDTNVGGGTGWFQASFGGTQDQLLALAVQPDGKFLLAGSTIGVNDNADMAIARVKRDLSGLDPAFNAGGATPGLRVIAFDAGGPGQNDTDYASWVGVRADGRIQLVGSANLTLGTSDAAFASVMPDGTMDASFGPNRDGRFHYRVSSLTAVNPIGAVLDRNGRLVITGVGTAGGSSQYCVVDRVLADGSRDPAFGSPGEGALISMVVDSQQVYFACSRVALQSDRKIVTVGWSARSPTDSLLYWGSVRLLDDGTLDPSYGLAGRVYGTFADAPNTSYVDWGQDVAIGDRGIIFAGFQSDSASAPRRFGVARVLLDLIFTDRFE